MIKISLTLDNVTHKPEIHKMRTLYNIICSKNDRIYIGVSSNFKKRKYSHLLCLRNGNHANDELQKDFNIYGEDCFYFDIIDVFLNDTEAYRQERFYINTVGLNARFGHYNIEIGNWEKGNMPDRNGVNNAFYGLKHTDETKDKISKNRKGKGTGERHLFSHTPEFLKKLSIAAKERASIHLRKPVLNIETGQQFDSAKECSDSIGIKYSTLKYQLQHNTNPEWVYKT